MKALLQLVIGSIAGVGMVLMLGNLLAIPGFNETISTSEFKKCHDECSDSMKKNLKGMKFTDKEIKDFNIPQKCVDFCVEALEKKHMIPTGSRCVVKNKNVTI